MPVVSFDAILYNVTCINKAIPLILMIVFAVRKVRILHEDNRITPYAGKAHVI